MFKHTSTIATTTKMGHPCINSTDPHLSYLDSVHLAADESTPNLIETLTRLYEIILQTPRHTTPPQWNQSLYAASLLTTTVDLLRARSIHPLDHLPSTSQTELSEIMRHPIEWTSVQILLSQRGERHLPQIFRVYDHMQLTTTDKSALLHRLLATLGKRELLNDIGLASVELRPRIEARRLLEQIRDGSTDADKQVMIDNLIWFRHDDLSMVHLLEVLLVDQSDVDFYQTSCLVYGAFLDAMQVNHYLPVFWAKLLRCINGVDGGLGEVVFRRCCSLTHFYDVLVGQIGTFCQGVRQIEMGGDYEWVGDRMEFWQVRRIVCLLLDRESLVRDRFADHLNGLNLDVRLRSDLFQFVIYD